MREAPDIFNIFKAVTLKNYYIYLNTCIKCAQIFNKLNTSFSCLKKIINITKKRNSKPNFPLYKLTYDLNNFLK